MMRSSLPIVAVLVALGVFVTGLTGAPWILGEYVLAVASGAVLYGLLRASRGWHR
jgi:hypothetical protein